MGDRSQRLSGWGRYPVASCRLERPRDESCAQELLTASDTAIARGNGRSYGDSSLNPQMTLSMLRQDRMLAFDETDGRVICQAGVLLSDLIAALLPRGWFAPVTPGTRYVTVGGMIASDVHGKNHHGAGSFCDHLEWVDLALAPDLIVRCSPHENADLFGATCGGMGLTGIILRAAFRMFRVETAAIRQRTIHAPTLVEALHLIATSSDWTYSVAWIDCLASGDSLGRSVVFLGEHARPDELPVAGRRDPFARPPSRSKSVPLDFPDFALSAVTVRIFNALYYRAQRPGEALATLDKYFYPLDALQDWNRIYGRRGFMQYQCLLPPEESASGLRRLLTTIAREGDASFLAVLKLMGNQSFGLLSFPHPGFTLALFCPVKPESFALMNRLDAITAEHGGRLYLGKDARAGADMVTRGYPRLDEFRQVRSRYGLTDRFQSLQSRRLEL